MTRSNGLSYTAFFQKYGGAARTKNIDASGANPAKRRFHLPKDSALPKEFIRLCPWEIEYLYGAALLARQGILEVGRFNGGSTFLFASARPDIPVFSIDLGPQDDDRLRALFGQEKVGGNVKLIVGDSRTVHPDIGAFDLLFIDGDHTYEGCLADIKTWYPRLAPGGHVVFHDSYLGMHGVQDAIMDFLAEEPGLDILLSPLIGASYWHYPAGSIAHLWKRRGEKRQP